jgi:hypothetical protein
MKGRIEAVFFVRRFFEGGGHILHHWQSQFLFYVGAVFPLAISLGFLSRNLLIVFR